MAKDKMNIPQIRFKGFDENWKKNRLSSIFSIFSGNAFSSKDQVEKGILWLKIADVGIQKMTPNNLSYLPFGYEDTYKKYLIKKDDVVIALTRPILDKHLKIAVAGEKYHGALLNQRVGKIVSSNNHIPFIYCLLQQEKIISDLESSIAGTDPPNLSLNEIKNISLAIPIKEEQTQIGDFFQKIDQVIELQQKALDTARAYKQSMLQKMFPQKGEKVPRVRFAGFSGDWEESKLEGLVSFSKGKGYSRSSLVDNGNPIILYGSLYTDYKSNINNVTTFATPLKNSVYSEGNEVILPSSGESDVDIARASAVTQKGVILGGDLNVLKPKKDFNNIFMALNLTYSSINSSLVKRAQGQVVVHLYNSDIQNLKISFPTLEEQIAIGNFFQKLDQQIEQQRQKLATYQQLKKAMLQRMFV